MSAQGWWISVLLGERRVIPAPVSKHPRAGAGTCNLTPDPNSPSPRPNGLGAAPRPAPPPGLLGLAP